MAMTPYDAAIQIGRALICLALGTPFLCLAIIDRDWIAMVVLTPVCLMTAYFIIKAAQILVRADRDSNP